jgi:hypothetical protein
MKKPVALGLGVESKSAAGEVRKFSKLSEVMQNKTKQKSITPTNVALYVTTHPPTHEIQN